MLSRCLLLAVTTLSLAVPLAAQDGAAKPDHPNFSGTWVMDPAKSSANGQIPLPTSAVYIIGQHGDTLVATHDLDSELGKTSTKLTYGFDGKAWPNTIPTSVGPVDLSSTLSWDNATLKIYSTASVQGTDVVQTESWTLNPDGTVLTILSNTSVGGEDYAALTLVMVRKP